VAAGSHAALVFALELVVDYLVLNHQVNNVYAQVGLVTLIGLAAKNGILIADLAKQRKEAGLSDAEEAIGAASSRLRPILMTASAALSGFFPLVVASGAGAMSQRSIGSVIFGGLLVATLMSLLVVPAFYVLMKRLEANWFPGSASKPSLSSP
jgi:HAE1 family hydrophobic/amphiphilic exporter-1